ncbi:MAG: ATP-binding protein [Rhodocyclaceae bacterium]|nr:ATP-binding protein [Rhodocyclaceae bacterium]
MTPFEHLSLRWKIPLRVMGAVLGTAFAVTLALIVRDYDNMRSNRAAHARSLGHLMANTLVAPFLHDDVWRAYEIIQSARQGATLAPELQAEVVLITDADFRVFVSSRPRELPIGSDLSVQNNRFTEVHAALARTTSAEQIVLEPTESPYYFVATPLIADGVILGHVILAYSKQAFLPRFVGLLVQAIWVTALVLLVLVPISWIWARRTGAPLMALAEAMRKVPSELASADLAKLPKTRDEIGEVGAAFRRMLEELKKKQELEQQMLISERLAAVGRLAAGIAHEINNPLAGMLTAIKTFQRHGQGDAMAIHTLSLLERGLEQIRNTVGALLVETKTQDRPFEPADVDDVLILVEGEAQAKQVRIQRSGAIFESLPLPATLIRQILLNLLLNAIAAADPGGMVKLTLGADEGMLHLAVCNDGAYISEEQMRYLFEPFASGRDKGHGLGLWVVYQIVKQLNGSLAVDSEPGCTTFSLDIPYVHAH